MKKQSLILLLVFLSVATTYAQDTVRVQALEYTSQTRDTFIDFPDGTESYRQILMHYNMRCKGARVSTGTNRNLGCGEWDYSCNTYIEDSTRTDSLFATTADYTIDGFSGSVFNYKEIPIFDYYRNTNIKTQVTTSTNLNTVQVGIGNVAINKGVPGSLGGMPARTQHLYTADELTSAGLSAGEIWKIAIDAQNQVTVSDLRVNMKHSLADSMHLSSSDLAGFTNVYSSSLDFVSGQNEIQFHAPFFWDGTSNIIVDFTSSKTISFQELLVSSSPQDTTRSIASTDRSYILFNGTNYAESISYAGELGSQNRTCEAWIKTTGTNQEIVGWGKNATGQKWVFRTNTDGSLRVEVNGGGINATTPVNDDQWHHVVCVLDGSNVADIKLYVDGELDPISATTNLAINTVAETNLRISRGINNRYFVGGIDNVRIWDVALSQSEIKELMRKRSQPTDANWNNLKAYFRFENSSGNFVSDESSTDADVVIFGEEQNGIFRATTLFKDFIYSRDRVNIAWTTGDFTVTNNTEFTFDQVAQNSNLVKKYIVTPAYNTVNSDAIDVEDSYQRWNADIGEAYYDEFSQLIETKTVTPDGSITPAPLTYTRRWPSRLEIMSFVTPYGIGLDLGPEGKTWTFDMTDFTPILKGRKRIFLSRGGQNQEEMDISFSFIKGTPPREVLDIREIWPSQQITANYQQILDDFYYPNTTFGYNADAKGLKLRSAITGHGQEGEFIPREHTFIINGDQIFSRQVWKECADNPVYPQGGTWIYDRAGWCPGMATDVAQYDLTDLMSEDNTVDIDYTIDAGSGASRYIISSQVVTYGAYNYSLDASITDILRPSNKIEHGRDNPVCSTPTLEITNYGSESIKNAVIEYWVNNQTNKKEMTWYGNLAPNERSRVYLPVEQSIWTSATSDDNTFYARIKLVNSQIDENPANDEYRSRFELPKVFPTSFYLFTRPNNAPDETKVTIRDEWGTIVFSKENFTASTFVRDTITLGLGCYTLEIEDSDDDGLSFFANDDGDGVFRVMRLGGGVIEIFENDFGKRNSLRFTVQHPLSVPATKKEIGLSVYPNPTQGDITLTAYDLGEVNCEIINAVGQSIYNDKIFLTGSHTIHMANNPTGIYYVKIEKEGTIWTERILLTK